MSLDADVMFAELETFCDARAPTFTGFPITRATIQAAFGDDVEEAYFQQLRLADDPTARAAAADFADAWRAGMRAIAAGTGGAVPPSSTTYRWAAWVPTPPPLGEPLPHDVVDDRRTQLATDLEVLFTQPTIDAVGRLRKIAGAFHRATVDLTATSDVPPVVLVYR